MCLNNEKNKIYKIVTMVIATKDRILNRLKENFCQLCANYCGIQWRMVLIQKMIHIVTNSASTLIISGDIVWKGADKLQP